MMNLKTILPGKLALPLIIFKCHIPFKFKVIVSFEKVNKIQTTQVYHTTLEAQCSDTASVSFERQAQSITTRYCAIRAGSG